jgi:hypothetical protein
MLISETLEGRSFASWDAFQNDDCGAGNNGCGSTSTFCDDESGDANRAARCARKLRAALLRAARSNNNIQKLKWMPQPITCNFAMAALDLDALIENLWAKKKLLTEAEVALVTTRLKEILAAESNVHHIDAPVVVVGDVHGQYHDVLEIFRIAGRCPDTNYLFLGT